MGCLWCGKYSRQCKTMPSGPPEFIPPFIPVTGMKCSYGKISSPLTEISVEKTEISVTEPARLLIWTHRKFYKGFRGEASSRKPGQPGQPGSYEEALRHITESTHDNCLVPWRIHRQNFYWSPTRTKTCESQQSVEMRTDAQHEHFSRSRPVHCFYVFSRLMSC